LSIELTAAETQSFFRAPTRSVRANALAFDQTGKLYVSESHSGLPPFVGQGGIWRIPRVGVAELLLQDNPFTEVGGIIAQVPVGANGIAFYQGDLYVANSDKGTIVRIQALPDGSPWKPEV
jgi:sugar lactone lactonase YvrE